MPMGLTIICTPSAVFYSSGVHINSDENKTGNVPITYVTLRHVRATILAVEKQRVLHILSVY